MSTSVYTILPLLALALFSTRYLGKKSVAPLPPGPKPLPLIGNLLDFPKKHAWLAFTEWKKTYGDVIFVEILGKTTVILNSQEACNDLLDKRSAIYSDRPRAVMLSELMGFDWVFSIMPYSARWRHYRRMFNHYINENIGDKYVDTQEQCVHAFLLQLLQDPENFLEHIRFLFGDIVLRTVYGIRPKNYQDKYVQLIEKTVHSAMQASIPGRFLVDLIPALKHVPSWFPFADFHREAADVRKLVWDAKELPAQQAQSTAADGISDPAIFMSMLERCKEEEGKYPVESPLEVTTNTTALAYLAGADTTLSTLQVFFLAMANYPQVQRMAQAELDAVIGTSRLPTFNDIQELPYISAIAKEVLRWHPVMPSGFPHQVREDDVYRGYLIPKGTIILPNTWALLHDPEVYPDPDSFQPSRWLVETSDGFKLNDEIPDPDALFGFGRRTCLGSRFAKNALVMTVANVLSCFNISALDDTGRPCKSVPEQFTDGLIVYPLPFNASIVPRSDKVVELIRETNIA